MKQFDNAANILDLVMAPHIAQTGVQAEITKKNNFLVIPGQYGPRWIVPFCSSTGKSVLSQWHPYNLTSKLMWNGLLLVYSMGLLNKVPGISTVESSPQGNIQIPHINSPFVPIVYVGTPGPQQKAVVSLVSPNSNELQAIMKVALGNKAKSSLLREAMILERLAEKKIQSVPVLLGVEEGGGRTWQSVVNGQLTSRKLTQAHIDWLQQLPKSGNSTTFDEQQALLRRDYEKNFPLPDMHKQVVFKALAEINGGEIPLVFVHGDFTPWNLKLQVDKKIAAIDWEDAIQEGLPLWDLCHFFLMQAHLFKMRSPIKKLTTCSLIKRYLEGLEIEKKHLSSLLLLYILSTIYNKKDTNSEGYRNFLLSLIASVGAL